MKVSAPHRGWTSGRATPSLRPNPYAAKTANPAGRHLSFAGNLSRQPEPALKLVSLPPPINTGLAVCDVRSRAHGPL